MIPKGIVGSLERFSERYHSFCRSPNIVRLIKYRSLRWTGHVAGMEEDGNVLKIVQVNVQKIYF